MDELFNILLVEDNPADVRLTQEALKNGKIQHQLHVVEDGVGALSLLRRQASYTHAMRPDIILLDLGLPDSQGLDGLTKLGSFSK